MVLRWRKFFFLRQLLRALNFVVGVTFSPFVEQKSLLLCTLKRWLFSVLESFSNIWKKLLKTVKFAAANEISVLQLLIYNFRSNDVRNWRFSHRHQQPDKSLNTKSDSFLVLINSCNNNYIFWEKTAGVFPNTLFWYKRRTRKSTKLNISSLCFIREWKGCETKYNMGHNLTFLNENTLYPVFFQPELELHENV